MATTKKNDKIKTNSPKVKGKTKKKSKAKKKKKSSLFAILFKFIFIALILAGLSYSLFFIKIDGKTAYSRIIKTLKYNNSRRDKSVTYPKAVTHPEAVTRNSRRDKAVTYPKALTRPMNKRRKELLQAKRRDRSLEKTITNKKRVDFINKKAISKKEKNNLDNIINSNL